MSTLKELVDASTHGPWTIDNGTILDANNNAVVTAIGATQIDLEVLVRIREGLDAYATSGDLDAFKAWVAGLG